MNKLKKIVTGLEERAYTELVETLHKNKADNFLFLIRACREGNKNRPTSKINSVPAKERTKPIGAMEKMLNPGRPACRRMPSATKKAGAPIIVIVVPSDAANESGINNFEEGIFRSRDSCSVTGSMMAVVVT